MEFKLKEAAVCADREFEMIKITPEVRAFVEESGIENGLVYVITEHTTTGITVNESLDCVEKDIMECLSRIAPETIRTIITITCPHTGPSEETHRVI